MKLTELPAPITHWAHDRNLVVPAYAGKQRLKLISEAGELADSILINDVFEIKDAIGDMFVVLVILAAQTEYDLRLDRLYDWEESDRSQDAADLIKDVIRYASLGSLNAAINTLELIAKTLGHDLTECANLAYNVIKDRKGKTVNGTFIKNE